MEVAEAQHRPQLLDPETLKAWRGDATKLQAEGEVAVGIVVLGLLEHIDAQAAEMQRLRNAIFALNQTGNAGTAAGCDWCLVGLTAAKQELDHA